MREREGNEFSTRARACALSLLTYSLVRNDNLAIWLDLLLNNLPVTDNHNRELIIVEILAGHA